MVVEGVDYSTARPSPAGLYKAGKRFAIRYLYGTADGKAVTRAEIDALHAAGLDVVLNWEWAAGEAKGGYAKGQDRARRTRDIVAKLGAPDAAVVYFSVDYDARDMAPVREYFRGVTSVWPKARTGVYGGRRVIEAAKAGGWCPWLWQTYGWSAGVWVPGVHIQQYRNGVQVAGGDVDLDRAMTSNFGQWRAAEEGDMPTAKEIAEAVWEDYLMKQVLDDRMQPASAYLRYNNKQIYTNGASLAALRADVAAALGRDPVDEDQIVQGVLSGLGGKDPQTIAAALLAVMPPEQALAVGQLLIQG